MRQRSVTKKQRSMRVRTAVPTGKVKEVTAMLKAIHAQEDRQAAKEKAKPLIEKLHAMISDTQLDEEWGQITNGRSLSSSARSGATGGYRGHQ